MYEVEIKFNASDWGYMDKWLDDNITEGTFLTKLATYNPRGYMFDVYYFVNEEDAMAFKLRWV